MEATQDYAVPACHAKHFELRCLPASGLPDLRIFRVCPYRVRVARFRNRMPAEAHCAGVPQPSPGGVPSFGKTAFRMCGRIEAPGMCRDRL